MKAKEVKILMKKIMSLMLGLVFVGSLMVVGCAPKQEEATQQAPVMEETVPAAMENTPAAEVAPETTEAGTEVAPAE